VPSTAQENRTGTNIASRRGGGDGSAKTKAPAFSGSRIKLSRVPGVFDTFREDSGDDKTGKLVEVTIIKAGVSLNGLDYLPATLKEAASLFEGVPIYAYKFGKTVGDEAKLSHLPEKAKTGQGNVGNMVGQIKESWWDEDRQAIRGLVAIFDEATRGKLREAFDAKLLGPGVDAPAFGLSIDAAGLKEGAAVTKVVRPESVDMVKRAAAGGAFDRLVAEVTEEEDTMKPEEIKALAEAITAGVGPAVVAAMKEAEDGESEGPPKAPGAGADPMSGLRKLLEGASPEERKALATRVLAMFREMGLAEASPEDERSAKMHESLREMLKTEKNPAKLKESIGRLIEESAIDPKDPNVLKLEAANAKLREMAIGRALDTFALKDGGTFHDIHDAIRLADLSAVKVKEDFSEVAGLTEALTDLVEAKPYLVKRAAVETVQESADDDTTEKPAPRGQSIRLTEEDGGSDTGATRNVKALSEELAGIDKLLASGSGQDRDLVRRAKVGAELKRAQATA